MKSHQFILIMFALGSIERQIAGDGVFAICCMAIALTTAIILTILDDWVEKLKVEFKDLGEL